MIPSVCYGGQFQKAIFIPCSAEIKNDEDLDNFVSSLLAEAGPLPPGLLLGASIRGRNDKLKPVVRVPFYGVPFTICADKQTLSIESIYCAWINRFKQLGERNGC